MGTRVFVYVCMIKSVYPKTDLSAESLFWGEGS